MKRFSITISTFTAAFLLSLAIAAPVSAYTGVYVIAPTIAGGPNSVNVTQFDLNANAGNGLTHAIQTNLTYVQSIVIQTSEDIDSHILIKEYPAGSDQTFDIIVPQPVQNVLVQATVTIWAPDVETLLIRHEHQGEPTTFEAATKVQPTQTDVNGNVLWSFTVTSFSSFTFMQNQETSLVAARTLSVSAVIAIGFLALTSLAAPLALRRN